jgi:hypothetical protein
VVLAVREQHRDVLAEWMIGCGFEDRAGVADRHWGIADIVALVEAAEAKPAKRGSYQKRTASDASVV